MNPWLRRPRIKGEYDQQWRQEEWADFLHAVDRIPDTAGVFAFYAIDDPDQAHWLGFSVEYDTVPGAGVDVGGGVGRGGGSDPDAPAGEPELYHILQLRASAIEDRGGALPAVADPLALEALVAAVAGRFTCHYASIVPGQPSLVPGWAFRAGGQGRSLAQSADHLSGFEWPTYCPAHILDRIGGAAAARAGGAFHAVRELPGGLIALQAAPTPQDYGPLQKRRVYEALAAVLTPQVR